MEQNGLAAFTLHYGTVLERSERLFWASGNRIYCMSPADVLQFNMGHTVTYFVSRTVSDGLPATDLKSVNKSAENLFRCGHVQDIIVCTANMSIFVRAKCIPEMRKDRVYKLSLALQILI